jgi:cyclohexanone monooxygenase
VGGRTLAEHFANGQRSFHGFYVHGFPNLFLLGAGQNGVKRNFTDMLVDHAEHVVGVIADAQRNRQATRIEATAEAEADWLRILHEKSVGIRYFLASCTPSYLNGEGDVENSFVANTYGGGAIEFNQIIDEWRKRGDFVGLKIE